MICQLLSTWPDDGQDHYREREAIMAVDASHSSVSARRETYKKVVKVAKRARCELNVN